ncbi:MAG: hypothetical protein HON94_02145 [Methylococcales bacterium]|jgi:hypothetical protein|nr:hypothetical protein [Methylococcales bacterium]
MLLPVSLSAMTTGIFESIDQCLGCHQQRDSDLVKNWQQSQHYIKHQVGCIDCHGTQHNQLMTVIARQTKTCKKCHDDASFQSYQRSKHGVIAQIEQAKWDWNKPLKQANYRTPTCSYCHLHSAKHNPELSSGEELIPMCMECHSPRYIRTLLKTNQNMLAIGLLKQQEAKELITKYQDRFGEQDIKIVGGYMSSLAKHLSHIRLGNGHQSPDDQWWYGQPAIDGDLINLKSYLNRILREKRLEKIKATRHK